MPTPRVLVVEDDPCISALLAMTLEAAGYKAHRDFIIYGCVDATVSDGHSETIIPWFAETKRRFFPLVKDEEWGARRCAAHDRDLDTRSVGWCLAH